MITGVLEIGDDVIVQDQGVKLNEVSTAPTLTDCGLSLFV